MDSDAIGAAPRMDAAPDPLKPNLNTAFGLVFFFFFESVRILAKCNRNRQAAKMAGSGVVLFFFFLVGRTQRK